MGKGEAHTMAGKANQLRAARAASRAYVSGKLVNCHCTECNARRQASKPRTLAERLARIHREKLARWKARGIEPTEGEDQ